MISVAEFFFSNIWISVVIASAILGGLILAAIALFYFFPAKGRELLQAYMRHVTHQIVVNRAAERQNRNPAPRFDFRDPAIPLIDLIDEPPALLETKACESCGVEFRMEADLCHECKRITVVLDDLSQLPENSEFALYHRNYSLANIDSMQRYLDKRYVGMGHRLKPCLEIRGDVERGNVRTEVNCLRMFVGDGSATKSAVKTD